MNMIKKLQLKFVMTTMSILLAVFIAVLGSINVIMQTMLEHQSTVVLSKIASSICYDEKTSTFSYIPQGDSNSFKSEPADSRPPADSQNSTVITSTTTVDSSSQSPASQTTVQNGTKQQPQHTSTPAESNAAETTPPESAEDSQSQNANPALQPTDAYQSANAPTQTPTSPNTVVTQPPAVTTAPAQVQTQPAVTTTNDVQAGPPPQDWWNHGEKPDDNPYNGQNPPYDGHHFWWEYGDMPQYDTNFSSDARVNSDYECPQNYYKNNNDEQTDTNSDEENADGFSNMSLTAASASVLNGYSVIIPAADTSQATMPSPSDDRHIGKPTGIPPQTASSIDFFVVMSDTAGKFLNTLNGSDINSTLAQQYINAINKDGAKTGMIGSLQFYKVNKNNGTVFVFTDKSAEVQMLDKLMQTSILIGLVSFVLISILVVFLSRKSVEPVKKAFEKQKQFVSDASHELKTPLTIISANADVLAGEIGENKWLTYIKSQTERMSALVNDLLNLTRIENNSANIVTSEFNLSKAILNTALPFECQAFEADKKFTVDVQDDIFITASERHIKQMAAIFIDNAIKHSGDKGEIHITLAKQGEKKVLSVFNTGSSIPESERDKVFERFYRSDESRSRSTGGYGLGLAIAKSIIDYHKFKVVISGEDGKNVCFSIIMP